MEKTKTAAAVDITYYRASQPGASYWRCELPCRVTGGKVVYPHVKMAHLSEDEEHLVFPEHEGRYGVWAIPGNTHQAVLIAGLQDAGVEMYIDTDDDYLSYSSDQTAWSNRLRMDEDKSSIFVHRKVAGFADGVIASTEFVAEKYRQLNDNVRVGQNYIDANDWLFRKQSSEFMRIGFMGSHSHARDCMALDRAFSWLEDKTDVKILMFGNVVTPYKHTWIEPIKDLREYRKKLFAFDVGFAPLNAIQFNAAKSDIKVMEYAMARAMPIFSNFGPFRPWANFAEQVGVPQVVVEPGDKKGYLKAAKWAYANRGDIRKVADIFRDRTLAVAEIRKEEWRKIFV